MLLYVVLILHLGLSCFLFLVLFFDLFFGSRQLLGGGFVWFWRRGWCARSSSVSNWAFLFSSFGWGLFGLFFFGFGLGLSFMAFLIFSWAFFLTLSFLGFIFSCWAFVLFMGLFFLCLYWQQTVHFRRLFYWLSCFFSLVVCILHLLPTFSPAAPPPALFFSPHPIFSHIVSVI